MRSGLAKAAAWPAREEVLDEDFRRAAHEPGVGAFTDSR